MTGHRIAAILALAVLVGAAGKTGAPPEPPDYRTDDYRSPTPATLHGAVVLTTEEAHAYWEQHSGVFIDVLPRPPRPAGLPAATIWRPQPRQDIPASLWLPDTGYGVLAPVMEAYFEQGLRRASNNDRDRMIVFYCLANCWMSWNVKGAQPRALPHFSLASIRRRGLSASCAAATRPFRTEPSTA